MIGSLAELARFFTHLRPDAIAHLHRLAASWGLLADLCFADLMLFGVVGKRGGDVADRFVVLGQVRPTTAQTLYRADWVGTVLDEHERPMVARTFRLGEIIEGETTVPTLKEPVRVLSIPVRHRGNVVAVLTRESAPWFGRVPGDLERTYIDVFNRFARMIGSGDFPFDAEDAESEEAPRVGDGVIVLDGEGRVEYTSPNAVSTLHRLGVHVNAEGLRFSELGLEDMAVRTAFAASVPVTDELPRGLDVTVLIRCIPLVDQGAVTGAVVLIRDISELRRRDLLLLSKDATIREIHHRVKNNLQTISSLLRLQGRRLDSAEAKLAIEESVRRIRSMAVVHEILSREASDDVAFDEIVRPLVAMVDEAVSAPDRHIEITVRGDGGILPASVATSLAVLLNELLQNATDHAYPRHLDLREQGAHVVVEIDRDDERLHLCVIDDGVGLPEGFQLEESTGLGLSIVRTLVTTELGGEITIDTGAIPKEETANARMPAGDAGDAAHVGGRPSGNGTSTDRPGTVVALTVPIHPS
jgi:two-component system, sensor histidine kinase PdtaS